MKLLSSTSCNRLLFFGLACFLMMQIGIGPNLCAQTPDLIGEGRKRFETRCAACHGADGMGGERAPAIGRRNRTRLQSDQAIRELIRNGLPEAGMPGFQIPEPDLTQLVAFVKSRITVARETPIAGDAKAGEAFFFGQGNCAQCHMIYGRGGLNGPDLTETADRLTLAEMEHALKYPDERQRFSQYKVASVRLRSGKTLRGFIRNESGYDLQLQGFDQQLHFLNQKDIAEISRDQKSFMPPLQASGEETRNLLAFLVQQSSWPSTAKQAELPGSVKWEAVVHPKSGDWPTYNGLPGGNRHSSLKQITPENVSSLAAQWMFSVPGATGLEVTPVVVGDVMYVTKANSVYALDARTGRQVWEYSRPRTKGLVGDAARGINRGVAVLGDRVFIVTDNAHLLALHRINGALLWDVKMADSKQHYGATSAPLVVNDLVISGVSGGDEGIRGFLAAYKAATGERVWQFWTVPLPGEPLSETWKGRAIEYGCAATWFTGTYDPETNLLFWPIGNPCPDFNGDERKGDNLYSDSVLALEPATGKLKWHYQFTPHDLHDWDATETPVVVNAEFQGKPRKLLLQGNRNGFFYVLDRTNGQFLMASPFIKHMTWATGIGKDGRPILVPNQEPSMEGTKTCPSMDGATNWMSPAYSPRTDLFYLMVLEKCSIFTKSSAWWKPGQSFYGGAAKDSQEEQPKKYLRALNLQTGKIAWEYPQTGPGTSWAGLLSTESGLIFFGDDNGALTAVHADSGKPLWHFHLNQFWKASPMTYMVGGKQYIAVAGGSNIFAFALP